MARKPAGRPPQDGEWDDAADEGPEEAAPGGRRLDAVADVLAALPAGEDGRALKLALLDALEASARADRIALPVEVQGLRARVRAGTV